MWQLFCTADTGISHLLARRASERSWLQRLSTADTGILPGRSSRSRVGLTSRGVQGDKDAGLTWWETFCLLATSARRP